LIEGQKLDITTISLAQVTEQFLNYVRQLEEVDATSLSDYLAIAAKLLVIKSKAILPSLEVEADEEDSALSLQSQLEQYKQYRDLAKLLKQLDGKNLQSFTRSLVFSQRISFFPDPNITVEILKNAAFRTSKDLEELKTLPEARIKEAVSIQQKITFLQNSLAKQIETKLSTIIAGAKNKSEVIVTFLAMLELIKQRVLTVEQESIFSDITLRKTEVQ
jgi:segregation and condensation protein A